MSDAESLRYELEQRPTAELISILRNRDEDEWRPEVFDIVAAVLRARGVSPDEVTALGPEGSDLLDSERMVTVANFFSSADAHTARTALEDAGLPATVTDEEGGTIYGFGIGTRLQVRAVDAEAAAQIVSSRAVSAEELPPDLAEPPCPACGSKNVASEAWVQEADENRPWWRETRRKWYYVCSDCQEAWPA